MKLKYNLTEEDVLTFEKHILKIRTRKLWIYVFWSISTLYLVYFYFNEYGNINDWIILAILLILVGIFFLLSKRRFNAINKASKETIQEDPYKPGTRSLEIKNKEVIYTKGKSKTRYVKGSFTRIKEIDKLFILFTGKTQAIIIPKSIMDKQEIWNIRKLLKEFKKSIFTLSLMNWI